MAKPPKDKDKGKGGKVIAFKTPKAVTSPVLFQLQTHPRVREVRRLLTDGETLETVATFVQTDIGLFQGMTPETVMRYLGQYRDTIPKWEFREKLEAMEAKEVVKAIQVTVRERVDVIAETEKLFRMQVERIDTMRQKEITTDSVNPFLGKEIERGLAAAKTLAVLYGDVRLASQVEEAEGTPATPAEAAVVYGSPAVAETAAKPESRRKVLQFAERLLSLANANKLPAQGGGG